MTKQTIKITGLAEYSPLTDALATEYSSLQSNAAKRRLMLDCLRYGYALEKMGLGALVALLERQDLMALPESERAERFISMAMSLMGVAAVTDHQQAKKGARVAPAASETPAPARSVVNKQLATTQSTESEEDASIPGTKPLQVESGRQPRSRTVRLSRPSDDSNS